MHEQENVRNDVRDDERENCFSADATDKRGEGRPKPVPGQAWNRDMAATKTMGGFVVWDNLSTREQRARLCRWLGSDPNVAPRQTRHERTTRRQAREAQAEVFFDGKTFQSSKVLAKHCCRPQMCIVSLGFSSAVRLRLL